MSTDAKWRRSSPGPRSAPPRSRATVDAARSPASLAATVTARSTSTTSSPSPRVARSFPRSTACSRPATGTTRCSKGCGAGCARGALPYAALTTTSPPRGAASASAASTEPLPVSCFRYSDLLRLWQRRQATPEEETLRIQPFSYPELPPSECQICGKPRGANGSHDCDLRVSYKGWEDCWRGVIKSRNGEVVAECVHRHWNRDQSTRRSGQSATDCARKTLREMQIGGRIAA